MTVISASYVEGILCVVTGGDDGMITLHCPALGLSRRWGNSCSATVRSIASTAVGSDIIIAVADSHFRCYTVKIGPFSASKSQSVTLGTCAKEDFQWDTNPLGIETRPLSDDLALLENHEILVNDVAALPGGPSFLAAAGVDGAVRVAVGPSEGGKRGLLFARSKSIKNVFCFYDLQCRESGRAITVGSSDIRLWHIDEESTTAPTVADLTSEVVEILRPYRADLAQSFLAAHRDGSLWVRDLDTGKYVGDALETDLLTEIVSLDYIGSSMAGQVLVGGYGSDHSTRLNVLAGQELEVMDSLKLSGARLTRSQISVIGAGGQVFAAVGSRTQSVVSIWNLSRSEQVAELNVGFPVAECRLVMCDGRPTLVIGTGVYLRLFDLESTLTQRGGVLRSNAFLDRMELVLAGQQSVLSCYRGRPFIGSGGRGNSFIVTCDARGSLTLLDLLAGASIGDPVEVNDEIGSMAVGLQMGQPSVLIGDRMGALSKWDVNRGSYSKLYHFPGSIERLSVARQRLVVKFDRDIVVMLGRDLPSW